MSKQTSSLFLVGFFICTFVWFGTVAWLLSIYSGWRSLSRRFSVPFSDVPIATIRVGTFRLSGIHFNNCIWLAPTAQGLAVLPLKILRAIYPPLYFPWSELLDQGQQKRAWRSFRAYCLRGNPATTLGFSTSPKVTAMMDQYTDRFVDAPPTL